ncbi:hypothetical protein HanOQP8_Chr02g0050631 [Helianthus annuus]|nr:hypothetical protein HanOQP8_Chr02g0050631 [Helianthus annuus]
MLSQELGGFPMLVNLRRAMLVNHLMASKELAKYMFELHTIAVVKTVM